MTKDAIDSIGQGRVWTGEQALEKGLVDKLGGINTAIEEAASLADIEDYSVIAYNSNKDFLTKLLESKLDEMKIRFVKNMLGERFEAFQILSSNKPLTGILARMPVELEGI